MDRKIFPTLIQAEPTIEIRKQYSGYRNPIHNPFISRPLSRNMKEVKKMKNLARNKKALSPVIATVILISVTIVVAVAVAYWMGAIAGGYTTFEQIELPTIYASYSATCLGTGKPGWKITIDLKNTGSADATVNNVFLNDIPLKDYPSGTIALGVAGVTGNQTLADINVKISKGESKTLYLYVQEYNSTATTGVPGCTAGTRIALKIHSAAGRDYPTQVRLP